jgi:hypothetical protein
MINGNFMYGSAMRAIIALHLGEHKHRRGQASPVDKVLR